MPLSLVPLTDLALLEAALREGGLPADDLAKPGRQFWRAVAVTGETVGFGGWEGSGADVLLRSVVIGADQRGRGFGRKLVGLLAAAAHAQGVRRLWLLTLDAAPFFTRLGFARADRDAVPASIATSRQFTGLCPASAVCLMKVL